jgi:glycosyltransferase involved in cell wall biosynthesis
MEVVLIDASQDSSTYDLCVASSIAGLISNIKYAPAKIIGAAAQRNQGMELATQPVIGFIDDDILLEPECIARLWRAFNSDARMGGASAMITNQRYQSPGFVSRTLFLILAGKRECSYAGRALGPAVNLLPEDRDDMPEVVPVEWLNLGCTLYRREALPDPPFPSFFTGYSMMEDATLSIRVGRTWKLANARTARIYHDSQSGEHKSDPVAFAKMELVNRHYVMAHVLGRRRIRDYAKLALWELFQLASCALQERGGAGLWKALRGKILGISEISAASRRTIS